MSQRFGEASGGGKAATMTAVRTSGCLLRMQTPSSFSSQVAQFGKWREDSPRPPPPRQYSEQNALEQ